MRIRVLCCAFGFALSLAAQSTPPPPPVSEQGQSTERSAGKPAASATIVVTATRGEREVSELPISTTVVGEQHLQTAAAGPVDDVLRTVAGVQMPAGTSTGLFTGQSVVAMRGLGDASALVMLDGIPLHDPFDGTIYWGRVPLDNLRQAEVVRGASASLFGNYAAGGVINLITRPVDSSLVGADGSLGSFDTSRGALTIDQRVTGTLGLRLSHMQRDSAGYVRSIDPGAVDIKGWNDNRVTGLTAGWDPTSRTVASFKTNWSDINVSNGTAGSWSYRDLFDASAGVHHSFSGNTLVSGTFFHQRSKERLQISNVPIDRSAETPTSLALISGDATGGSLEWLLSRSGLVPEISVGIDVQEVAADEERSTFNRSGAVVRRNLVHGRQVFGGVFGQASWRPHERVEVLTSVRVDHYRNRDGFDAILGGVTTEYAEKNATEVNPRVSVRYGMSERLALRASAYRAFKAPTIRRLYRLAQFGGGTLLNNPDLEPEILTGGEVGAEWAFSRARLEVNLFQGEIAGALVRGPVPGQPPTVTQYTNLGRTRSRGVETMASATLSPGWSVEVSYTWLDSRIVDEPRAELEGNYLNDMNPHNGSISVRYATGGGTSVQLRARVLSSSYADIENTQVQPAHRVVDLFLLHPLRPWMDGYLRVENGLDEEYFYVSGSVQRPAQPRAVTAGVRVRVPTGQGARG